MATSMAVGATRWLYDHALRQYDQIRLMSVTRIAGRINSALTFSPQRHTHCFGDGSFPVDNCREKANVATINTDVSPPYYALPANDLVNGGWRLTGVYDACRERRN